MKNETQKLTNYRKLIPKYILRCIDETLNYGNKFSFELVPHKDQEELLKKCTHLKGRDFLENRKVIYEKIFHSVFLKNGEPIPASLHKKKRLIFPSSYTGTPQDFLQRLQSKSTIIPHDIQKLYNNIDNGGAVVIDFVQVAEMLPEYIQLQQEKYPYAFHSIYSEARAICRTLVEFAQERGHNIIDLSSSYSRQMEDSEIEALKVNVATGKKDYELITLGLAGEVNHLVGQPSSIYAHSPPEYLDFSIVRSLKSLAHPDSLKNLLGKSDKGHLIWDNGNRYGGANRFVSAVNVLKGVFTMPRRDLWNVFKDYNNIKLNPYQQLYSLDNLKENVKRNAWGR